MIEFSHVTNFGQINLNETLVVEAKDGRKFIAIARIILHKGTDREEIVFCRSRNDYFIMQNYLDGKSWVKNVTRLPDVQITAITNTTKEFIRH